MDQARLGWQTHLERHHGAAVRQTRSESGADALVVSNHGGRQADGAPSGIAALADIVDSGGGGIEILMEGGIRSGQDVIKALALGARGVYMGRPFLDNLGAGGKAFHRCRPA